MSKQNGHESVGALLRREREARNLSLKDAAAAINIRTGQLDAIETGNIGALPGMVYAIGFVRSYAVQLGLDSDEITAMFKQEHAASAPKQAELNISPPPRDTHLPSHFILAASGAGLALLLALWFIFSGGEEKTEKTVPEVPAQMQAGYDETGILHNTDLAALTEETPADAEDTPPVETVDGTDAAQAGPAAAPAAAETETAVIPAQERQSPLPPPVTQRSPRIVSELQTGESFGNMRASSRIILIARDSSWVQLRDGKGETLFQQVLRPGQSYYVPPGDNIKLATANAGGIDVYVDGKKMPPFGKKGDIIRGISLDADSILGRSSGR